MQETLYQTSDTGDFLSDSGCRRLSIRQRMQTTLYQTVDAGVSPSDSGRDEMRKELNDTDLLLKAR